MSRFKSILGLQTVFFALTWLAVSPTVTAQYSQCPPAPAIDSTTTSVETKTALDGLHKFLASVGIDVSVRKTRDNILKDNPRADQVLIVLTMANMLCEMIWSDTALSGEKKAIRFHHMMQEVLVRAVGPEPLMRTDRHKHSRLDERKNPIVLASTDSNIALLLARNEEDYDLPTHEAGYLRAPPFYINDFNKYFVIVGSARSREEGVRLIERLKSLAPQYDFALFDPYGENSNYAIMIASWVPLAVAKEALQLARRDVAHDAYIWACRSSGAEC